VAADDQVGVEIVNQIVVSGGEQEADAAAGGELADVERQHLGERAVEDGAEFVGEDEWRAGGESLRRV
jgi:hypothetical protein